MKLKEIFANLSVDLKGLDETEISDLGYDSRSTGQDSLFFAVRGFEQDGRRYIPQAFANGAALAVVDSEEGLDSQTLARCVVVSDLRSTMSEASANFFGRPSEKLDLFGITGTNGKSSCGQILAAIFEAAGKKCAVLGTIECRYPGKKFVPERTTMESVDIQRFLAEAVAAGCQAATIEVSAHALSLHRVFGVRFAGVLFTNLTPDHEDFYPSMEEYFAAKKKLFTDFRQHSPKMCANYDDEYGRRLMNDIDGVTGFSADSEAVKSGIHLYDGSGLKFSEEGVAGEVVCPETDEAQGRVKIESNLVGRFNRENILASVSLAHALGVSPELIARGVEQLRFIPGRLERIDVPSELGFQVYVDFAHSGGALDNLVQAVREVVKNRLILVFGAGGDKDPMRRVHMAKIAAHKVDVAVITSDNPRNEDPKKIIQEIVTPFDAEKTATPKHIIEDRAEAIRFAIDLAGPGDIVLIAGKGHEQGQIIKGRVLPFSDQKEAVKAIQEKASV